MISSSVFKYETPKLKFIRPNFHYLKYNDITLWFSYETLVAFETTEKLYCCENVWGNTTGKHLNYIQSDKKLRIPYHDFIEFAENNLRK